MTNKTEEGNCDICDQNPCICEISEADYYDDEYDTDDKIQDLNDNTEDEEES